MPTNMKINDRKIHFLYNGKTLQKNIILLLSYSPYNTSDNTLSLRFLYCILIEIHGKFCRNILCTQKYKDNTFSAILYSLKTLL